MGNGPRRLPDPYTAMREGTHEPGLCRQTPEREWSPMKELIRGILVSEEGATAVEYALMLAFIASIIAVAVRQLGLTVRGGFAEAEAGLGP